LEAGSQRQAIKEWLQGVGSSSNIKKNRENGTFAENWELRAVEQLNFEGKLLGTNEVFRGSLKLNSVQSVRNSLPVEGSSVWSGQDHLLTIIEEGKGNGIVLNI